MPKESFATRLRAVREARHYTLQEMADLLGTSKQVICRYENGQRTPKISVAADYAHRLQVDLLYQQREKTAQDGAALFGQVRHPKGEGVAVRQRNIPQTGQPDQEILQLFSQLPPEKQEEILDYIRYKLSRP